MNKLGIAIAIAGASLTAIALYAYQAYSYDNARLSKRLKELRDDLELDRELIEAASEEYPKEIVLVADRKFAKTIEEAVNFASTILGIDTHLSDEKIDKLSPDAKRAYIECFGAIIQNAERYLYAIDDARDLMRKAHKNTGINY